MRLLVAEDEIAMAEAVEDVLRYHHYSVQTVQNGEDALYLAKTEEFDGIILDIMMPKLDGLSVLQALRQDHIHTPVLLLTAKSTVEDRIAGLNLGADDYLPKPFAMGELLARVRAMLRRREDFTPDVLELGGITLDRNRCILAGPLGSFQLSRLEFQLLELFMLNPGITFSTQKLLERVWGYDTEAEEGTVWVYISYLRKKLSALNGKLELRTKRRLGYCLEITP
jgi:two-component system response regulator ArlR